MMNLQRSIGTLILGFALLFHISEAQEITVAAAADLQFAMQDIAGRFEKESGKHVKVIYGSSGNVFQQIQNGAPFDMFFSATLDYPRKLEAAGLIQAGSYFRSIFESFRTQTTLKGLSKRGTFSVNGNKTCGNRERDEKSAAHFYEAAPREPHGNSGIA